MRRNLIAITSIVLSTIISMVGSWLALFLLGRYDSFSDVFGIMLSAFSTIISVVALIYAMITYYSIDRVQSMNSMEGNVLCNPNYSVAYPENIQQFEKCKDEIEFGDVLFEILFYKKPTTCQEYAQGIQCIIDNLTWIAWAKHDDSFYQRCDKMMKKLYDDKKRFSHVNSGLNLLIEENIKLIDTVIHYQNHRIANDTALCPMENIRGKILENPLARLTFHNYLGLEYMKRARDLLGINNLFSYDGLREARMKFKSGEINQIRGYYFALLEIAEKSFSSAAEIANEDLVWNGYISYNYARARLMQYICNPEPAGYSEMEQILKTVLKKRENILFIIWKDDNQNPSFLHQKFIRETSVAKQLLDSFNNL